MAEKKCPLKAIMKKHKDCFNKIKLKDFKFMNR